MYVALGLRFIQVLTRYSTGLQRSVQIVANFTPVHQVTAPSVAARKPFAFIPTPILKTVSRPLSFTESVDISTASVAANG
jgi:hypothetical protein